MNAGPLLLETTHAEREAAAYNAWWAATKRQDHAEAHRLWGEYSRIHADRPASVVRAMEVSKGLR